MAASPHSSKDTNPISGDEARLLVTNSRAYTFCLGRARACFPFLLRPWARRRPDQLSHGRRLLPSSMLINKPQSKPPQVLLLLPPPCPVSVSSSLLFLHRSPFIRLCCLCFPLATRPNTSDPVADLCSSLPCSFRRPNHKLIPPPEVVDPAQGTALFSRNTIDHHGDVAISNCRDAAPGRLPKAQNTRWVSAAYHEPISRPDQTEPG